MSGPYFTWTYNYLPGAIVGSSEASQLLGAVRAGFDAVAADYTTTQAAFALKANLASPQLSGVPQAPTALAGDNTQQIATTAYVLSALNLAGISGSNLLQWERQMRRAKQAYWNMN
ncbi:hypothetical protein IGB42_01924 [Andreprevotia sp. IGB-42]|uniref:hypothetical protein n=1 Tax=Andreprevotia sp. IGB-42 TaxID=2497473 RepID=UPI00135AAD0B|nr:hypothetical protein [Andreprevotia sp. IGB-42]KAF0813573.1 hypothetical protein IGB42_01924 [Andreprevotia sp. IGB-42]